MLAGSDVNLSRAPLKNDAVTQKRRELFGDATGIAKLNKDVEFPSLSAAAVFVLGGSQNGKTEWLDSHERTWKSIYEGENVDE